MKKLLLLAALSSMGCSDVLGNEYFIVIDPGFSEQQREGIVSGVLSWKKALGILTISSISIGDCWASSSPTQTSGETPNINFPTPGNRRMICFHTASEAEITAVSPSEDATILATTFRHANLDSADIFVSVTIDNPAFVQTIAHETGHAMGLEHIASSENLMYWRVNKAIEPSCDDIQQYLDIRKMGSFRVSQCPDGGSYIFFHN